MIFEARKHFQSLQAVNAELPEKIVSRRERPDWQLKMLGRQVQHFLSGLFQGSHGKANLSSLRQEGKFTESRFPRLRKIWHGAGVLDKFLQGSHDGGGRKFILYKGFLSHV